VFGKIPFYYIYMVPPPLSSSHPCSPMLGYVALVVLLYRCIFWHH